MKSCTENLPSNINMSKQTKYRKYCRYKKNDIVKNYNNEFNSDKNKVVYEVPERAFDDLKKIKALLNLL